MRAVITALCGVAWGIVPVAAWAQAVDQGSESRPPVAVGATVVDQVSASIQIDGDDRPPVFLLASMQRLATRLHDLDDRERGAPTAQGGEGAGDRTVVLQALGELLLEREALRASDPEPAAEALARELERTADALAGAGGVAAVERAVGITHQEFLAAVRRRVVVAQFLSRHLARTVEPRREEVQAAYDSERFGPHRAHGETLASVRDEIVEALTRENYARAVRTYVRSIGTRARIRTWNLDEPVA